VKYTKVYLDMDGVLCNFDKLFVELYGEDALVTRDNKQFTASWPDWVENQKGFTKLEWFPGAQDLLEFLESQPVELEILSSSGGNRFHDQVKAQKNIWLDNHDIQFKRNFVAGRRFKADYARPDTILIDDTPDVVEGFNKAGGTAILHTDAKKTLVILKALLGVN
jgi:hypothetical protein